MNFLFFFALVCFSGVFGDGSVEQHQKFLFLERHALKKCQKDGNFPESYVDDVFRKRTVPPDSECFVHCAFKGVGWLNDAGDPDVAGIMEGVKVLYANPKHSELVDQFVNECNNSATMEDQCAKARHLLSCVFEKDKAKTPKGQKIGEISLLMHVVRPDGCWRIGHINLQKLMEENLHAEDREYYLY